MNIIKMVALALAILTASFTFAEEKPTQPTKAELVREAGIAAELAKADELTATEARDVEATRRRGLTFLQARKEDGLRVVEAGSWADGQVLGVIGTPFTWTSGKLVALANHSEPTSDRLSRERLQAARDANRQALGLPTEAEAAEKAKAKK